MTWDVNYPQDSLPANTLDLMLRNTKVLIRERAVAFNGIYDEHNFFGLVGGAYADGSHPLSTIGWVQIHSSFTSMVAAGPYNIGSLHYAIGSGLYVMDGAGVYQVVSTLDHTKLVIDNIDYHTQYYLKDGSRPMQAELQMDVPLVETTPQTGSANPMPGTHDALTWYDAHGVDGEYIINRHFLDNSQTVATVSHGGVVSGNNVQYPCGNDADSQHTFFPAVWYFGTSNPTNQAAILLLQLPSAHGGYGLVVQLNSAPTSAPSIREMTSPTVML